MASNSFGNLLRITSFGESHGKAVGVVLDGFPANFKISEEEVQKELDRRRPGQSNLTTPRDEKDLVKFYSGVFEGKTLGTPIMMMAENANKKSSDYEHLKNVYRPSHADYVYEKKYGFRDFRGGGRSSARETWARVAAGAFAQKYLREEEGIEIFSFVSEMADLKAEVDFSSLSRASIEANLMRCPDSEIAAKMEEKVKEVKREGNSIGGIIRTVVKGMKIGLGEPVYEKLSANLAKGMMTINAVKGFDIGSGFNSIKMTGKDHNDEMRILDGEVEFKSNYAGGVLGGISSGQSLDFRTVFKPTATIFQKQATVNKENEEVDLEARGRHDPCVLPRAVPIVDAMTALVLMDFVLLRRAYL